MYSLIIKKQDKITHGPSEFASLEELQSHLSHHQSIGSYGIEAVYKDEEFLVSEEVRGPVDVLVQEAEYDQFGEELTPALYEVDPDGLITPAVYETRSVLVSPRDYEIVIEDISAQVEQEAARQAKVEAGKLAREVCQEVLDMIAGYNLDRELTIQQITQLQTMMAAPEAALRAGRPTLAKQYISAVVPDGDLVTQEMKDLCLQVLANY
jgi:hypothetical protein